MSDTGGTPEALTNVGGETGGSTGHMWPEVLPGGQAILFTLVPRAGNADPPQLAVLDLRT